MRPIVYILLVNGSSWEFDNSFSLLKHFIFIPLLTLEPYR